MMNLGLLGRDSEDMVVPVDLVDRVTWVVESRRLLGLQVTRDWVATFPFPDKVGLVGRAVLGILDFHIGED